MYVRRTVKECDFTGRKYDKPVPGCAAVTVGASGHWYEVMWMGPEYMAENNITSRSYDEAVTYLVKNYPEDVIDF